MDDRMLQHSMFHFDRPCDLLNALHDLRSTTHLMLSGPEEKEHLQPLIDASNRSNSSLGRLTKGDVMKMIDLGRCTHSKLLVLLLEPTKESTSTIMWIDSLLRSASGGSFNATNTAILNCRALIPNASYNKIYKDDSPYASTLVDTHASE